MPIFKNKHSGSTDGKKVCEVCEVRLRTLTILSEVPARDTVVPLSPTSEGSVWDIQLVTMAMVLSTAPIFSSGTLMVLTATWPYCPPSPTCRAPRQGAHALSHTREWRELRTGYTGTLAVASQQQAGRANAAVKARAVSSGITLG